MALIVHKYGGTSMGSTERIRNVAKRVAKWARAGHQMVVVPSAMSGETNRLLGLAKELSPEQSSPELMRELDMIAATGEQVSVGLLSIALQAEGMRSVSYTGWQVPIETDSAFTKARIQRIDDGRVRADLAEGKVVIITGFQGIDPEGHITTLGRGGSDTSAVAVAAAMKADECLIYTDVDGVYTTDPRIVPEARRLHTHQLRGDAGDGEPRLQGAADPIGRVRRQIPRAAARAVELHAVGHPDRRGSRSGTLITFEEDEKMEQAVVSGIAFNRDEAKVSVMGVPDRPGIAFQILGPVAEANIDVDVIIQNVSHDGKTDFSFTVHRNDYARTLELLKTEVLPHDRCAEVAGDPKICKVSIVGIGMRSHVGVAEQDVPGAVGRGHQHPDDHDQRDQDQRRHRREVHGARGTRAAQGLRSGAERALTRLRQSCLRIRRCWSRDREAEGAPLLREYVGKTCIEGSNPSDSASLLLISR